MNRMRATRNVLLLMLAVILSPLLSAIVAARPAPPATQGETQLVAQRSPGERRRRRREQQRRRQRHRHPHHRHHPAV